MTMQTQEAPMLTVPKSPAATDDWVMRATRKAGNASTVLQAVTITPEIAREMLTHQDNADGTTFNRALSRHSLALLKHALIHKRWKRTHQGIAFAPDGTLLDGRHRLTAISQTDISAPIDVWLNQDPATFSVLDVGRRRAPTDFLSMLGISKSWSYAATARVVIPVMSGVDPTGHENLSADEIVEFTRAAGSALKDAILRFDLVRQRLGGRVSAGLAAAFFLIEATTDDDEAYEAFVETLKTGVGIVSEDDPTGRLRQRLLYEGAKRARPHEIAAMAIKAWNATRRKDPIRALVFKSNEAFPEVER